MVLVGNAIVLVWLAIPFLKQKAKEQDGARDWRFLHGEPLLNILPQNARAHVHMHITYTSAYTRPLIHVRLDVWWQENEIAANTTKAHTHSPRAF